MDALQVATPGCHRIAADKSVLPALLGGILGARIIVREVRTSQAMAGDPRPIWSGTRSLPLVTQTPMQVMGEPYIWLTPERTGQAFLFF
jgi:hypothetical protein